MSYIYWEFTNFHYYKKHTYFWKIYLQTWLIFFDVCVLKQYHIYYFTFHMLIPWIIWPKIEWSLTWFRELSYFAYMVTSRLALKIDSIAAFHDNPTGSLWMLYFFSILPDYWLEWLLYTYWFMNFRCIVSMMHSFNYVMHNIGLPFFAYRIVRF